MIKCLKFAINRLVFLTLTPQTIRTWELTINHLKLKSEFTRNVLTLMTGSTIAQAIPIAIMPILTRIYSPEEFGILALFVAVSFVLGSIANARYELAIILPKEDEVAIEVAALGLLISTIFSLFLLLPVIVFNEQITGYLGNEEIGYWLYFIPFSVWMIGVFNVLNFLHTRKKNYKDLAIANVYKSVGMSVIQLGLGLLKSSVNGLIYGQIFSYMFANYPLAKKACFEYDFRKVTLVGLKKVFIRYKHLPIYAMPAILANGLSTHLINVLISLYFSVATLGFYSIVQKVLGLPTTLIGGAIGQVYYEEGVKEKNKNGHAKKSFLMAFKKLFLVAIPVFMLAYFIVEDVFIFAFGSEWKKAGEYASSLILFFGIRFVSASLSITVSIFEKNHLSLIINLIILSVSICLLVITSGYSFDVFLFYFNLIMSGLYLIFLFVYYRVARG